MMCIVPLRRTRLVGTVNQASCSCAFSIVSGWPLRADDTVNVPGSL